MTFARAWAAFGIIGAVMTGSPVHARIIHFEILRSEQAFGGQTFGDTGAYAHVYARVQGEVDPADPRNAVVQDLNLAPRNARGLVEYSTEVELLKPVDQMRGNRILLFEVNNRGNKIAPYIFNVGVSSGFADTNALSTPGDGYLMRKGYTLLGKQVEELVAEGFRGHHPGLRSAFFQSPETRSMGAGRDLLALHKDGTEFPIEINLNPIETEEGLMALSAIVDISDRKQKEQRIQDALREKDLMLAEIHHRVKNNLQVIDSLLGLQSAQIHDPIALGALRDSQHRVRSMALIHETLYQSNTFAKIDFAQLLNTLVPALMSSYEVEHGRITLSISATPIALPLNSAIPCGLIVNELTSNALKHAFPNGQHGEIELTLRFNEAGCVALSFADNGVGIPADVDLDNTTGLGLQLIRSLVRQMHGTLQIERANPTRFLISFPNSVSVRPEGMRVI